jgi:DUF2075 family protein
MIVYQATKSDFQDHVLSGDIENIILNNYRKKLHKNTSPKEIEAWKNSLIYMDKVLADNELPSDIGVSIECQIPQTSKRIDFIVTGNDISGIPHVVIIELKQWSSAELTSKDGIVKTALGRGIHETSHPSYQAWSYATLLNDFSEVVYTENISLKPCAFLHNYEEDNVIRNSFYKEYTDKAPVFLKKEMAQLRDFIKKYVKSGDKGALMYRIEQGKIKPSRQLADTLSGLLKGNREFVLIDEQKLVYETALELTRRSIDENKKVLIVEGGPGTGKSVVAINLLVEATKREWLAQYVTKNAAPRAVYESKLSGDIKKKRFSALFQGSGSYISTPKNSFDLLIVDEAHRLNAKSGMFQNLGENQIIEIIQAARTTVFFIDENQKVTLKDIGTKEEIEKWARLSGAETVFMQLASQFRCNGSDGYLAWLDNLLQIKNTANYDLTDIEYEFKVFSNPADMRNAIFEKNKEANKARMVAGYCWDWVSQKDIKKTDINFPEFDFHMPWNFAQDSYLWSIKHDSVGEIGCIHTCQGLELDYVGVIIGPDLICRDGKILTDPTQRAKTDASIKGYKKLMQNNPEKAKDLLDQIIKNTYRTLMTRGMKGCYVYCTDEETREWMNI